MRYLLSIGCLLMLLLQLPWLSPFNPNTATVVAALSSTVLAVVGAFALWGYQVRSKQRDLDQVVVPVFEPLYASLCQVRDLSSFEGAKHLLTSVRRTASEPSAIQPSDQEVRDYQGEAFPRAIDAATVEAASVLGHWSSLQDILLGISPKSLPKLLALHRIASGAVNQLPHLETRSKPQYLEQIGPQVSPADAALLSWAIGRMANILNELDYGHRDESGYHAIEPGRAAALRLWGATTSS